MIFFALHDSYIQVQFQTYGNLTFHFAKIHRLGFTAMVKAQKVGLAPANSVKKIPTNRTIFSATFQ